MLYRILNLKLQYKVAFFILLLAVIWISSGKFRSDNEDKEISLSDNSFINVQVIESNAQEKMVYLSLMGEIEAFRSVNIIPEVSGKVLDVLVKDGDYIKGGDTLVKVEKYEKVEQLNQAKALLKQRELEYKASQSLNEHGYRSEINDTFSFTALEAARADVKRAQISLDSTEIKAPFSGFVDKINVQVGELILSNSGLPVAQIVDFDKIRIITYVPEKYLNRIKLGNICKILITKDHEIDVPIVFVSKIINRNTRTYRLEMLLNNNDLKILTQGAMYSVKVPIGKYSSHKVSSSVLDLRDNGDLGIKIIVDNKVKFVPVEIVDYEDNGNVWIINAPDTIKLITLGHEYVEDNAHIDNIL
ncbi:efflux RND transporter periplasmic adaptor subunit [Ehrlichia sp. JZT12]